MADGATPDEAVAELEEAKQLWIETPIEEGYEVPEPLRFRNMRRGRFVENLIQAAVEGWTVICATEEVAEYGRQRASELGLVVDIRILQPKGGEIKGGSAKDVLSNGAAPIWSDEFVD